MAFLYRDLIQSVSALETGSLRITLARAFSTFLACNTSLEWIQSFALIRLGFLEYTLTLRMKKFHIFFLLLVSFLRKLTSGGYKSLL